MTTKDGDPIIIGIENIATIESYKNTPPLTVITMNFSRGIDNIPKTIYVKESFEDIKSIIGI